MAEKLSIDLVFDKNWCDIPASVKLKCIGKMEFKERLSLRCTAKAERSLVDSQKINFLKGVFWGDSDDGAVQVQNASYWHVQNYDKTDSLYKVAQIWIDKSSKNGSIFQVSVDKIDSSFDEFLKHFTDRIVSKTKKRVRIRTNNPDSHILLERAVDKGIKAENLQFFRLMVISSEMKESEYDDSCKEWVCKMDPEVYLEEWEHEFSLAPYVNRK
ncbi:hypothetical protein B9Z55_012760 [Caenorhabditis nigoni]|uniref:F-box domain-containing protein n=1 Tax=Caenorhabditis nigoni TaxID=1611254 RepID=A0A2G5TYP2_9PELO|nr:hypothetical protein B9Z55_012760 [Caenorhabditis nigoni]